MDECNATLKQTPEKWINSNSKQDRSTKVKSKVEKCKTLEQNKNDLLCQTANAKEKSSVIPNVISRITTKTNGTVLRKQEEFKEGSDRRMNKLTPSCAESIGNGFVYDKKSKNTIAQKALPTDKEHSENTGRKRITFSSEEPSRLSLKVEGEVKVSNSPFGSQAVRTKEMVIDRKYKNGEKPPTAKQNKWHSKRVKESKEVTFPAAAKASVTTVYCTEKKLSYLSLPPYDLSDSDDSLSNMKRRNNKLSGSPSGECRFNAFTYFEGEDECPLKDELPRQTRKEVQEGDVSNKAVRSKHIKNILEYSGLQENVTGSKNIKNCGEEGNIKTSKTETKHSKEFAESTDYVKEGVKPKHCRMFEEDNASSSNASESKHSGSVYQTTKYKKSKGYDSVCRHKNSKHNESLCVWKYDLNDKEQKRERKKIRLKKELKEMN